MENNRIKTVIFFIFLFLISCIYNYHEILFYGPFSMHAWRQADCLSFTLNYFNENLNFFTPEINGLGPSGDGKTVSEFPIIYYIVAQLWKIFGQKEFIFRIKNVSIVFFGLFNLYRLSKLVLRNDFYSIFIPLFFFTSPVLVYYSNNFLADAPAMGFALSGCYFLYTYIEQRHKNSLYFSLLFFLLGGLTKITSLMIFFSIAGAFFLELFFIDQRKIDQSKLKNFFIGLFVVLFLILCWYSYARYYDNKHNAGFFLQGLFPIWETTSEERKFIFDRLYFNLMPSFFNRIAFATVLITFVFLLIYYRKVNRILLFVCIFCFLGLVTYLLFWFKAFDVHDYYLTNLTIFIPLVVLTFFDFLRHNHQKLFEHPILKIFLSLVLLFLIYQTALKTRIKYEPRKYFASNLILKKSEREFWEYYHWAYNNNFKAFETIKPYLRSIGISRTDKVICFADESINISLYLMDQKGFTKYGYGHFTDKERVNFAVKHGCKYLILTDEQQKDTKDLSPFLENKVGQYQNIQIYFLK